MSARITVFEACFSGFSARPAFISVPEAVKVTTEGTEGVSGIFVRSSHVEWLQASGFRFHAFALQTSLHELWQSLRMG